MKRYICASAGCFASVDQPRSFCQAHQAEQRERDARRRERERLHMTEAFAKHKSQHPEQAKVWTSARWKVLRREQLAREPMCKMCGRLATSVDHIIPHRGDPDFAYNADNLQSLCHACHNAKTRADRINHAM